MGRPMRSAAALAGRALPFAPALLVVALALAPAARAAASIGPIVFARAEADAEPVEPTQTFEAGIKAVYAFFEFHDMDADAKLETSWTRDGGQVMGQTFTVGQVLGMTGHINQGKLYVYLTFEQGAPTGHYGLDISLDGTPVQHGTFTVGNAAGDGAAAPPAGGSSVGAEPPATTDAAPAGDASGGTGTLGTPEVSDTPPSPDGTARTATAFPSGVGNLYLVFSHDGLQPGTSWGWRVSREGRSVAEATGLVWDGPAGGLSSVSLGKGWADGLYDVDLFLAGQRVGSGAFDVGEPGRTPGKLLESDDFDDPASGWGSEQDANATLGYADHRFLIDVHGDNVPALSTSGTRFTDAVLQIDATPTAGPDDNAYGMLVRYQDPRNFYAFLISSDGYVAVLQRVDGDYTWLQDWQQDTPQGAIVLGKQLNRLRLLTLGPQLRFYVNDQLRAVVDDATWPTGQAGAFVATLGTGGVQVAFDRWRAWAPGAP